MSTCFKVTIIVLSQSICTKRAQSARELEQIYVSHSQNKQNPNRAKRQPRRERYKCNKGKGTKSAYFTPTFSSFIKNCFTFSEKGKKIKKTAPKLYYNKRELRATWSEVTKEKTRETNINTSQPNKTFLPTILSPKESYMSILFALLLHVNSV